MGRQEILVIVAMGSGMGSALLAFALADRIRRIRTRLPRSLGTFCIPLCLLSLPLFLIWFAVHKVTGAGDVRPLWALAVMGFAFTIIMDLADKKKSRRI
jgi:hypothetical protein